jgi:hypothetical protein
MKEALTLLNELVADGVMGAYAIGGAMGATFYTQAINTEDIDVFVTMAPTGGLLLSLTPIYEAAKAKGAVVSGEYLVVGNWPVQLLPPPNALVEEALLSARSTTFDGVPTRVMTAEHLCAIALQIGRQKDYARVSLFIDDGAVDIGKTLVLLRRYNLIGQTGKVANWPTSAS